MTQAHKSSYQRMVKENKADVLEWPSQSPELTPIEMLWKDLKQAVHRRKPTNITELKWLGTEERATIPTSCCAGLISSYKNHYL